MGAGGWWCLAATLTNRRRRRFFGWMAGWLAGWMDGSLHFQEKESHPPIPINSLLLSLSLTNVILLIDNIQPPWWIFIQFFFFSQHNTHAFDAGWSSKDGRERGSAWRVSRQHSNRQRKEKKEKEITREKEGKSRRVVSSFKTTTSSRFSQRERLWGYRVVHKMAQRDPLISSEWIDKTPLTDVPSYLSRKRLSLSFLFRFFFCI